VLDDLIDTLFTFAFTGIAILLLSLVALILLLFLGVFLGA